MRYPRTLLFSAGLVLFALFATLSATAEDNGGVGAGDSAALTPSQRFADLAQARSPSYRRDVVPLLARAGCSGRECHGSFQGRGGFQLSLFGSEWEQDYGQLTEKKGDEGETHINLSDPEKSLILLKPTMQVKHKGKERFKKDSWQYNLILKWIRDGGKNDADQTGELQRLEVSPAEIIFSKSAQAVQVRVLAHWNNGRVEDVTELTRFKSNDDTVASVSEGGLVSSTGKGDSHIVASYDSGVLPIPVMLPVSEIAAGQFPATPARTKIDDLVLTKLHKVGIVPSDICTDAEFLRRVSLDLTGTLPTPDAVTAFLADPAPDKRSAKIEELLKTPAYAAWWTTKFCDYTGNSPRQLNFGGNLNRNAGEVSRQWYDWLYKRVADNTPYDKMVADIVLATSRTSPDQTYQAYSVEMDGYFRSENPVDYAQHPTLAYFWQRRNVNTADEKALAFSHTFLGVRLECAQCHKHPFDRWTKNDFKQFTAFFGPINSNQRPPARGEEMSYQSLTRELREKIAAEIDGQSPDEMMMMEAAGGKNAKAAKSDAKALAKADAASRAKTDGKPEAKVDAKTEAKSDAKLDAKTDAKVEGTADVKTEGKALAAKADIKPDLKSEVKADGSADPKAAAKLAKADAKDAKKDQAKQKAIQKALADEIKRRIDAGQPVPWNEVWVNSRGIPTPGKNGGKVDLSISPKILGGEQVAANQYSDLRQPLMDWLRSASNPYFAKAIVNRVWATYFNRGIVDPPDDMNLANAPSNAELLNYLADGFVAHGYDMQWLHREILNSDTYQRSWKTNASNALDTRNFSHAVVRQLPAEVMFDAIAMAVAPTDKLAAFAGNIQNRAIGPNGTALYAKGKGQGNGGGDAYFLTLFGKPLRETNCDCERSTDPTLLQTLFTRNDPALLSRIEGGGDKSSSWIAELRGQGGNALNVDKTISDVFLRTVGRPPTPGELTQAQADIAAAARPIDGIRDLLWAMINTREFKVNH